MYNRQSSDLSSALTLSSRTNFVKNKLEISANELTSGKTENLAEATGGDLRKLFEIERTLDQLRGESRSAKFALGKASLTQLSLQRVHENLVEFGPNLLSAVGRGDTRSAGMISEGARGALNSIVSALNSKFGGHSVFSGANLDQSPISSSDVIITDIEAIVTGSADSAAAIASIDAYFFDIGAGYETNVFKGSPQDAPTHVLSDGTETSYSRRADEQPIREAIRSLAISIVAASAPNFFGTDDQIELFREAGVSAISSADGIIEMKESLGFSEGRLEKTLSSNTSMTSFFELERNSIVAVDLYEAATRLEALQGQLQTIYTLTARLSGLSLANYLR